MSDFIREKIHPAPPGGKNSACCENAAATDASATTPFVGNVKRAASGTEDNDHGKSKKPRLQLGGLLDKVFEDEAMEQKKKTYHEEVKKEKERLGREWWAARVETAPYKEIAARQEKTKTEIARLEDQKGKIEKTLELARGTLERSKEELQELDEEVSREVQVRTKAI